MMWMLEPRVPKTSQRIDFTPRNKVAVPTPPRPALEFDVYYSDAKGELHHYRVGEVYNHSEAIYGVQREAHKEIKAGTPVLAVIKGGKNHGTTDGTNNPTGGGNERA